jgi:hypothetical protein
MDMTQEYYPDATVETGMQYLYDKFVRPASSKEVIEQSIRNLEDYCKDNSGANLDLSILKAYIVIPEDNPAD